MYGGSVKTRIAPGSRTANPWSRRLRMEPLEARQLLTATAVNDSYDVSKNVTLTIDAPGVLANDTDSAGLALKRGSSMLRPPWLVELGSVRQLYLHSEYGIHRFRLVLVHGE